MKNQDCPLEIFGYGLRMTKAIIFHWQPGSGGDTIQHLLNLHSKFYTVVQHFDVDEHGKTTGKMIPWFEHNFQHDINCWYWRNWSYKDLDKIFSCPYLSPDRTLIIPTHRQDQARWLKKNISGSITMGICYPKNMYLFVLSQWCNKVAENNWTLRHHYQDKLSQTLRKQKLFGAYVLKEQLQFGSNILQEVSSEWDINLQLENLLIGDITILKNIGLDICKVESVLQAWVNKQKKLYRGQWNITKNLKSALGWNGQAPRLTDLDIPLDEYDRILIKHVLQRNGLQLPKYRLLTLNQANEYFKKNKVDGNDDKQ